MDQTEDLVDAANQFDHLAAMRARHEAVTWEHGNRLLDTLEKHASLIAVLLRRAAVDLKAAPVRAAGHEGDGR